MAQGAAGPLQTTNLLNLFFPRRLPVPSLSFFTRLLRDLYLKVRHCACSKCPANEDSCKLLCEKYPGFVFRREAGNIVEWKDYGIHKRVVYSQIYKGKGGKLSMAHR